MSLIDETATALLPRLASGEVTPLDLLDALEARIAEVEPLVHALPTMCFDRARARAKRVMDAERDQRGALQGLPVAMKDLVDVAGVRSTKGSPIFADSIPTRSAAIVERVEDQGGVIYAKSNTPEFGAGASTFNQLFETTRNPHDLSKSAAGSSGGAAAALASGMAWLAHGSDLGGSLRNPASFCGVVGLRPSVGLVPGGTLQDPFDTLFVEGPMARTVADCALFLDAMAASGEHRRAAERPRAPMRVAWSKDLGVTPVDPAVARVAEAAARRFEALGAVVEEANPDFSGAHEAFKTLRAIGFAASMRDLYDRHRDKLKPDVVWNIEAAFSLTGADVAQAVETRARIAQDTAVFFETYDVLCTPATIVPPFDADTRSVERVGDHRFETYVDWLAIVFAVTLTGHPAMSLPCGVVEGGLPVGLQLVGAPRGEAALLAYAAALEAAIGWDPRPRTPKA